MAVNVVALVVLVVFYLAILVVGLVAAWKVKVKGYEAGGLEISVVAGRDLKMFIGVFTMIATTVGGGYINGAAESVGRDGLAWTLAPPGIFIGLNIGGAFYAKKMRERKYLTMLDPFQRHYGGIVTFLIYLASLMGDLLWSASILNALGTTLSVIADIQLQVAVIVSGAVTVIYTMVGSMISVAYTDVVQLFFIFVGLMISLPFVFTNDKVGDLMSGKDVWLGEVDRRLWAQWVDLFIAMTLGSIPWQSYMQRVLSVRSAKQAQVLSFVGAIGALILVIPSVLAGMVSASADWNGTSLGQSPVDANLSALTLPLVIDAFTPEAVSILGLAAICAAVMSSMDSSVLGTSSMFTHNIYKQIIRKSASNKELRFVQILSVFIAGAVAVMIALWSDVIYGMFILAADIVFVIIYPQLTAVLYCPKYTNPVGAGAGFLVGLILRLGAGEPIMKMSAWIYFPFYSDSLGQLFPYRTFAMVLNFITVVAVTFVSRLKFISALCSRFEYHMVKDNETGHQMYVVNKSIDTTGHNTSGISNGQISGEKSEPVETKTIDSGWTEKKNSNFETGSFSQGTFRKLNKEFES